MQLDEARAATSPTPFVLSGQTVSGLFGPVRLLAHASEGFLGNSTPLGEISVETQAAIDHDEPAVTTVVDVRPRGFDVGEKRIILKHGLDHARSLQRPRPAQRGAGWRAGVRRHRRAVRGRVPSAEPTPDLSEESNHE